MFLKGMDVTIGLESFLILSAILFCCGLYTVCTRKNAVAILMGIELVLNAAGINLVAFSHFSDVGLHGQVFNIFVIALAAAEATIALAIVVGIYQNFHTIEADQANLLRE